MIQWAFQKYKLRGLVQQERAAKFKTVGERSVAFVTEQEQKNDLASWPWNSEVLLQSK